MHIKSVEIKNYRGFKDSKIEFQPKLNVFIGSNASGKTTLLNALIKSLYNITKHFANKPELKSLLALTDEDINYNETGCYIISELKNFPDYAPEFSSTIATKNTILNYNETLQPRIAAERKFVQWLQDNLSRRPQTIPIFKFYPANRGGISYYEQVDTAVYSISQLESWANIYQNSLSYSRFFDWFFDHETNELRLQRDANDFSIESPDLRGVRESLIKTFELLGYGEVKVMTEQIKRKNSSKLTPTLVVENLITGKKDQIDNKSDGEKALIILVADIAYNLSLAMDFKFGNNFLNSPGVVMIDEIESHLHPNWQREIIPVLTQLFPNIQFFVATHSPQVIASVNSESVYVCQDFEIGHIKLKTKGEDTNTLLKYIFNSTERPKEYIKLIDQIYHLMDIKSEYEEIDKLINQIKTLESEDSSTDINSLIEELKLQLEAYKFDREHEADK